jgi:hypothetical protein
MEGVIELEANTGWSEVDRLERRALGLMAERAGITLA